MDASEKSPDTGAVQQLEPDLRCVLAPNASPMTYWGTNTYLLGQHEVAVIDPGPMSPPHLDAILAAVPEGGRISHIFVTHAHIDHSPLALALSDRTGAAVHAFGPAHAGRSAVMQALARDGMAGGGEGVDASFHPDVTLPHGARVTSGEWEIEALHTPGHMGNHLCFAAGKRLFSGDLVMGWASSLVSPPDGDLTDFMASCRMLRDRSWDVFHAGHGAPITDPATRLDWLIAHREGREDAILEALSGAAQNAESLARALYTDVSPALIPAAMRNVFAHLVDLTGRKLVTPRGPLHSETVFERARA